MSLHISKHTQYQTWDGDPVFNEFPFYIRKGSYTFTIFFKDRHAVTKMLDMLEALLYQIDEYNLSDIPF